MAFAGDEWIHSSTDCPERVLPRSRTRLVGGSVIPPPDEVLYPDRLYVSLPFAPQPRRVRPLVPAGLSVRGPSDEEIAQDVFVAAPFTLEPRRPRRFAQGEFRDEALPATDDVPFQVQRWDAEAQLPTRRTRHVRESGDTIGNWEWVWSVLVPQVQTPAPPPRTKIRRLGGQTRHLDYFDEGIGTLPFVEQPGPAKRRRSVRAGGEQRPAEHRDDGELYLAATVTAAPLRPLPPRRSPRTTAAPFSQWEGDGVASLASWSVDAALRPRRLAQRPRPSTAEPRHAETTEQPLWRATLDVAPEIPLRVKRPVRAGDQGDPGVLPWIGETVFVQQMQGWIAGTTLGQLPGRVRRRQLGELTVVTELSPLPAPFPDMDVGPRRPVRRLPVTNAGGEYLAPAHQEIVIAPGGPWNVIVADVFCPGCVWAGQIVVV